MVYVYGLVLPCARDLEMVMTRTGNSSTCKTSICVYGNDRIWEVVKMVLIFNVINPPVYFRNVCEDNVSFPSKLPLRYFKPPILSLSKCL